MIGKLFGIAVLVGSLAVVYLFESSSHFTGAMRIFHWPAIFLTAIGPMALVTICSDWRPLITAFAIVFGHSPRRRRKQHTREAQVLQRLSREFYAEGSDAFDGVGTKGLSIFVVKMIERLANRMPNPDIRELLEAERDRRQTHLAQCLHVLALGVRLTPSVGMLGTILGMVQLLSSLQDPAQIGGHMSLALLTTFYGLFFSLVFWTPLQQKVEQVLDVELEAYNQTIRWLELLEKRKSATYFAETVDIPIQAGAAGGSREAA